MLEASVAQQEEFFRKNLSELQDQHVLELKILNERYIESENKFIEKQKESADELIALHQEISDFKMKNVVGMSKLPASDQQFLLSVQEDNNKLKLRIKELTTENAGLNERFRAAEQLRNMHEVELTKHRTDMNALRKAMQESMQKVLTEAKNEADENDETSGQIEFAKGENGNRQIKAATAEKLVERLTDPRTIDSQFQGAFMLTFRSYIDTSSFLSLLSKRFKEASESSNTPSLSSAQSNQSPIQLRVCNLLKTWIENYWYDFQDNKALQDQLNEFIQMARSYNEKLAQVVRLPFQRKLNNPSEVQERKVSSAPRPKPQLPKALIKRSSNANEASPAGSAAALNSRPVSILSSFSGKLKLGEGHSEDIKFKLMDLEPLEVARQLTMAEYELFQAIRPTEFTDQGWLKADKETRAPNICRMTAWSNHVTRWIVSEIVSVKDDMKKRALVIERVIMLAQHLEKLNNFNGVKEVLAGLQSSAVWRLKKTREGVNIKYLKVFDDLVKLTSNELNFKNLRAKIHASDPPLLPFPGIYQGDLVFLDTCSRNKTESGLVNFAKYQKIASYISELQVYQQTNYNFEVVSEIVDYVRNFKCLTDDEAYADSMICEPRESSQPPRANP